MPLTQNTSSPPLTQKDRAKIISILKKLVPERHINVSNPNQDYGPWIALVDERMPRLIDVDKPSGNVFVWQQHPVGKLFWGARRINVCFWTAAPTDSAELRG